MIRRRLLLLVWLAAPAPLLAQQPTTGEPPQDVRFRFGPLYMNPRLALTDLGIDTNVFNEPDQAEPKKDFTLTMSPSAALWLRFGPTWLNGSVREDLVYYQTYASQRSINSHYALTWVIPVNRLVVSPGASYLNTHERPGYEIDVRTQHTDVNYTASVEVRALSRTYVGIRGGRRHVDFDESTVYLGRNLQEELARTMRSAAITIRNELTPLTSLHFDVSREEDRFDYSPLRDSNSTAVAVGVRLDPFALIKGSATFGYRDFEPLSPDVPKYEGSTMSVDLSYAALESTSLSVLATRDVQYSYDVNEPYYLQTGVNVSLRQQIFGPIDASLDVGAQRLEYREREGASPITVADRVDRVRTYGAGVGYRMGRDVRVGFSVTRQRRDSPVIYQPYNGWRYGVSVVYGP
jgi:hypothetical protein